jgi:hypothetical protein
MLCSCIIANGQVLSFVTDFGERQHPVGRDVHARIRSSKTTNTALKFTHC